MKPWTKNQKYFELKLLELDAAEDTPGGCHDAVINVLQQIALDQREACTQSLDECTRMVGFPSDVIYYDAAVHAISTAEIGND